jgi:hypothetical protein
MNDPLTSTRHALLQNGLAELEINPSDFDPSLPLRYFWVAQVSVSMASNQQHEERLQYVYSSYDTLSQEVASAIQMFSGNHSLLSQTRIRILHFGRELQQVCLQRITCLLFNCQNSLQLVLPDGEFSSKNRFPPLATEC